MPHVPTPPKTPRSPSAVWKVLTVAFVFLLLATIGYCDQQRRVAESLDGVNRSATLMFIERNGKCIRGHIARFDAATITVQEFGRASITIERDNLLQVLQGNALLFSARSSWADVAAVEAYSHEVLALALRGGKQVSGKPVKVRADAIVLKHGLSTTRYLRTDIATVDYLRVKPPTDKFSTTLQDAPYALLLYPEFYYRVAGLEGRISVRLYDTAKPNDDSSLSCSNL